MKAMILAAGLGTRLGAVTQHTPKCLVEAGGKTLLEHAIIRLRAAGVTEVVINLHHLADKVRTYVEARDFGVRVVFSPEPILLDTGGGVKNAARYFAGEPDFFIHNADVYTDLNLSDIIAHHRARKNAATLVVIDRVSERGLLFNDQKRFIGWNRGKKGIEKISEESSKTYNFSGVQVVSSQVFEWMSTLPNSFSIIESYLAGARAGATIEAFEISQSKWFDVGTPERLAALQKHLGDSQ